MGKLGRVKLYAAPGLTLCDIDRVRPPTLERVFALSRILSERVVWARIDRSHSGRWHLIVQWRRRWTKEQTVIIQLILGSDWKREIFSFYRVLSGVRSRRWNFLFEEKLEGRTKKK